MVGYGVASNGDATHLAAALSDLDLKEWPLMAVIAVLVAVMADRVLVKGRRYAALYRAASDRLLTAQEDERRRLAYDLHDGVGQTLTALALTLNAAETALANPQESGAAGMADVHRAREMAGLALEDVRGVAMRLRPARFPGNRARGSHARARCRSRGASRVLRRRVSHASGAAGPRTGPQRPPGTTAGAPHSSPMSSFQTSGRRAMNSRMSSTHASESRLTTSTPRERR